MNTRIILNLLTLILLLFSCKSKDGEYLLEDPKLYIYYPFDEDFKDHSKNKRHCLPSSDKIQFESGFKKNSVLIQNPENNPFTLKEFIDIPEKDYSKDFTIFFMFKVNGSSGINTNHFPNILSIGVSKMKAWVPRSTLGYNYIMQSRLLGENHNLLIFTLKSHIDSWHFLTSGNEIITLIYKKWYCFTLTKKDKRISYYVDGKLIKSKMLENDDFMRGQYRLFLGRQTWLQDDIKSASRIIGNFDEFFIFDRALTDKEINYLYQGNY